MAETHVLHALRDKRAELSGEIIAMQKRLEKLRDDLDSLDRTIRVFDPTMAPEKIRPILKRKTAKLFRQGDCGRSIPETLRRSPVPMTTKEIEEALVVNQRLDMTAPRAAQQLAKQVSVNLANYIGRRIVTCEGKPARWTVARQSWPSAVDDSNQPCESL